MSKFTARLLYATRRAKYDASIGVYDPSRLYGSFRLRYDIVWHSVIQNRREA